MTEYSFFWLMLFASIVAMLGRFIKIPYTIALVLAGLVVGHLRLLPDVHLEPHLLFVVFLLPVLFEAGINIRFRPLRQYWIVIGALAVLGTVMSMLLIGYATHYLIGLPLITALLFGAIISSTDPISVMSLFKKTGVSEKLSLIV
ncbi:MAG: Na+ antiporter [Firmicutes bacterium]|nr:Na+ antiporter [Bacillota bacterium]